MWTIIVSLSFDCDCDKYKCIILRNIFPKVLSVGIALPIILTLKKWYDLPNICENGDSVSHFSDRNL